jgi:hypothetical protein
MKEPMEDEVARRARAICQEDGKVWMICELPVENGNQIVDDAGRIKYLNRAKQQLMREQANQTTPSPVG